MKTMKENELNTVVGGNIESIIEGVCPKFSIWDKVVFHDSIYEVEAVHLSARMEWTYDILDLEHASREIFGVPEKDLQSIK